MASDSTVAVVDPPAPFADFLPWFTQVTEDIKPELVVCIARSALRLMQMHDASRVLPQVLTVSQHTLPFLSDDAIRGRRILIFDDSVIYGSTLRHIYEYLVSRGGIPSCAAYIADKVHFFGEDSRPGPPSPHANLPVQAKHRLSPALVTLHHDALIRAVLSTSREYNPDFPTTSFQLDRPDDGLPALPPLMLRRHRLGRGVVGSFR